MYQNESTVYSVWIGGKIIFQLLCSAVQLTLDDNQYIRQRDQKHTKKVLPCSFYANGNFSLIVTFNLQESNSKYFRPLTLQADRFATA